MRKIISAVLSLIILASVLVTPVTVSAESAPSGTLGTDYFICGDMNVDGKAESIDALLVLQTVVQKTTVSTQLQGVADVNLDGSVTTSDALVILQVSVGKVSSFTDTYYIDLLGGGTNGTSPDAIPDKYQKKLTFKVVNGTWSNGTTADIVTYVTLKSNGKYSTSGTASLSAPTGMVCNDGYTGGAWNTTLPASVSGTNAVTYTYSFTSLMVNYTVNHYRAETNSTYPATPTATETFSGYVGATVTATAKSYTGYSLDTSKSTKTTTLINGNNVLNLYYKVSTTNYITDYSKTNAVNGAYVEDTTADNSFVINTESIKPYTLYRVTEDALRNNGAIDNDYMRLFYSLQGLINRDFGRDSAHTSIIYSHAQGTTEDTWLNYINETDSILRKSSAEGIGDGLTQINITTWDVLYANFKEVIKSCGIVLWDGNVPSTANVAATICGLDGYLPVLAQSPLHAELVADGVPVKLSLVGMFKNGEKGTAISGTSVASTGSAKNDAYLWALEKYYSRCSSHYIGYMVDGAAAIKGYTAYENNPCALLARFPRWRQLYNHDYLIARRAFFFDLAPYAGEAACDCPAQQSGQADEGTDVVTLKKILQARYNRAGGAFGQLIGFPPWWCKYSKEFDLGEQPATYLEWLFTETISCYNMAKEADVADTTAMTNGSVYYKYVPKTAKYTNNTTPLENITFDSSTYYYTIYLGDYDSSAWVKTILPGYFNDSARGTLPLMWGINPNLSYRIPMVFDYLYENKTSKDYFTGGDGGAGYIIPEGLFHDKALAYMGEKRPAGNADGGTVWANYSKTFYDRFGYEMTGFIINGAQHSITENIAKSISAYSPKLNFTNCHDTPLVKYNSTYFVHCHNGVGVGSQDAMYIHAANAMNNGYNFSAYRTVCLSPTDISQIVNDFNAFAETKGMKVKYVDPYTYYNLLKASNQGTAVNITKTLITGFDDLACASTAFSTSAAIETNNKTEGVGALRFDFNDVTANADSSKIGGMGYYQFTTPVDLSAYKDLSIDYWFSDAVTGSAAIQVNFVTNGMDDGFNYMIPLDGKQAGWHTMTFNTLSPGATANNPDWSSISSIRFTYFNYSNTTTPNFIMLDNLLGLEY